ncbi:sulfurtransferase TusA family protein [Arabiibacter massiliensis]|uniref:sulfurtransferase TusA family protein n=1 Tax=Arabiibacter massiliensis TaxID=1870985 RepID=UPI0009BC69FC|nr:sulfurtransferase TusA family protein [Arabiibacter massiliensis]
MLEVDARGLSCPEPVMMAMDALKRAGGQPVRVLVSASVARDNVMALAKRKKKSVQVERVGDDYALVIE